MQRHGRVIFSKLVSYVLVCHVLDVFKNINSYLPCKRYICTPVFRSYLLGRNLESSCNVAYYPVNSYLSRLIFHHHFPDDPLCHSHRGLLVSVCSYRFYLVDSAFKLPDVGLYLFSYQPCDRIGQRKINKICLSFNYRHSCFKIRRRYVNRNAFKKTSSDPLFEP